VQLLQRDARPVPVVEERVIEIEEDRSYDHRFRRHCLIIGRLSSLLKYGNVIMRGGHRRIQSHARDPGTARGDR
jgi:hypothetical protein